MPDRGARPPERIDAGRAWLRRWSPGDAPAEAESLDRSLETERPWKTGHARTPGGVRAIRKRLERSRAAFDAGEAFGYGVFDRTGRTVLGSVDLRPEPDAGAMEVVWVIRSWPEHARRDVEEHVVKAAVRAAFRLPWVRRVRFLCRPDDGRKPVAEALGFRQVGTRDTGRRTPDGTPVVRELYEIRRPRLRPGT